MDIDRLLEAAPDFLRLIFYVLMIAVFFGVIFAVLRIPREIRKNRAVLTKIPSVLRSIDRKE